MNAGSRTHGCKSTNLTWKPLLTFRIGNTTSPPHFNCSCSLSLCHRWPESTTTRNQWRVKGPHEARRAQRTEPRHPRSQTKVQDAGPTAGNRIRISDRHHGKAGVTTHAWREGPQQGRGSRVAYRSPRGHKKHSKTSKKLWV